ncbi:MAG: dehydrogenase [Comamonadaceae bacterium]|nr:dehydrogenase [Comamonadaceae bacterium]
MPTYMLLIIEPPAQRATRTEAQGRAVYARMQDFGEGLRKQGKLLAVESLASQASAVRVSLADGDSRVLDGPFSEAKEMVGGFFMIDCADQSEAVIIAQQCPAAEWATVEVRSLAPCFDESSA